MPQALDPMHEVAAAVVAESPQLRARMQRLVNALMRDMEHTVQYGSPEERARLARNIVPSLLRSMQGADAAAADTANRDAYERIMAAMRGEVV